MLKEAENVYDGFRSYCDKKKKKKQKTICKRDSLAVDSQSELFTKRCRKERTEYVDDKSSKKKIKIHVEKINLNNMDDNLKDIEGTSSFNDGSKVAGKFKKFSFKSLGFLFKRFRKSKRFQKREQSNEKKENEGPEEIIETNLAMAIALPSGLNLSKSSQLKIEFEVEQTKTENKNKDTSGDVAYLSCTENSTSAKVFEGTVKVPSNCCIRDVLQMPLYILNPSEPSKGNSKTDLQNSPIKIKPSVKSEINEQDEKMPLHGLKVKIQLSVSEQCSSLQSNEVTNINEKNDEFLRCSIVNTNLINSIDENVYKNINVLFHIFDKSDSCPQSTSARSIRKASSQNLTSNEKISLPFENFKNISSFASGISEELTLPTSLPSFFHNNNNNQMLDGNGSLYSVESVWPQSASSNVSTTRGSLSSNEVDGKVPSNTPLSFVACKSDSVTNIAANQTDSYFRITPVDTNIESSDSIRSNSSFEKTDCNFFDDNKTRHKEYSKNSTLPWLSEKNEEYDSNFEMDDATLNLLKNARFKLLKYADDSSSDLLHEGQNRFSCSNNYNNTVKCYFATSISRKPKLKVSEHNSDIHQMKSSLEISKTTDSQKETPQSKLFFKTEDNKRILPENVMLENHKNKICKSGLNSNTKLSTQNQETGEKGESSEMSCWVERINQIIDVIKEDMNHVMQFQDIQDELLKSFVLKSEAFLITTDRLLQELTRNDDLNDQNFSEKKQFAHTSKMPVENSSCSFNDFQKYTDKMSSTTIRRSSEYDLNEHCVSIPETSFAKEIELVNHVDVLVEEDNITHNKLNQIISDTSIATATEEKQTNDVADLSQQQNVIIQEETHDKSKELNLSPFFLNDPCTNQELEDDHQQIQDRQEEKNEATKSTSDATEMYTVKGQKSFDCYRKSRDGSEEIHIKGRHHPKRKSSQDSASKDDHVKNQVKFRLRIGHSEERDKNKVTDKELIKPHSLEIRKTYAVVQKDVQRIIKELLTSSQEIKNEIIFNGATEEEPSFTYKYLDKKQSKKISKHNLEKNKIEHEMRQIAYLIVDLALDKAFKNSSDINTESVTSTQKEERIGDQCNINFNNTFKVCLEELLKGRFSFPYPGYQKRDDDDINNRVQKYDNCSKTVLFYGPKSLLPKIPKTSYVFGKNERFEDPFFTKTSCTSSIGIDHRPQGNFLESAQWKLVNDLWRTKTLIEKNIEDEENSTEEENFVDQPYLATTANIIEDESPDCNNNINTNLLQKDAKDQCADNDKNEELKSEESSSNSDGNPSEEEREKEASSSDNVVPPAVKESPKFQFINKANVIQSKQEDSLLSSCTEDEEQVIAIDAESSSREALSFSSNNQLEAKTAPLKNIIKAHVRDPSASSSTYFEKEIFQPSTTMKEEQKDTNLKKIGATTNIINETTVKENISTEDSDSPIVEIAKGKKQINPKKVNLPFGTRFEEVTKTNIIEDNKSEEQLYESSLGCSSKAACNHEDSSNLIVLKASELYNNKNSTSNITDEEALEDEFKRDNNNKVVTETAVKETNSDRMCLPDSDEESSVPTIAESRNCTIKFEQNLFKSTSQLPLYNNSDFSDDQTIIKHFVENVPVNVVYMTNRKSIIQDDCSSCTLNLTKTSKSKNNENVLGQILKTSNNESRSGEKKMPEINSESNSSDKFFDAETENEHSTSNKDTEESVERLNVSKRLVKIKIPNSFQTQSNINKYMERDSTNSLCNKPGKKTANILLKKPHVDADESDYDGDIDETNSNNSVGVRPKL